MKSSFARIAVTIAVAAFSLSATTPTRAAVDSQGRDWRQLTETMGMTWNQVAALCPRDGVTPCSGSLSGWVWATREQVTSLFGIYEPAILTSTTGIVSGPAQATSAESFFGFLLPTFTQVTPGGGGYTGGGGSVAKSSSGWTASTDAYGVPYAGAVSNNFADFSAFGSFSVVPTGSPAMGNSVFLWRSTAIGSIIAYPDFGQLTSFNGGVGIANVLSNDWVNGARATTANVILSQVSASSSSISLNAANGAVAIAAGTSSGTHSLVYQICDRANPTRCAQTTATVTIPLYPIVANDDVGVAPPAYASVAVANVLANDTFGGQPTTLARVQLSQLSSSHPGISLDVATGRVNAAANLPLGTQTLTYQICEIANPTNCDPATVTITVRSYVIDAVNDYTRASSKYAGVLFANVLANDTLEGAVATVAKVRLTQISVTPANPDITLNVNTGAIQLAQKTSSMTYVLVYQICEINAPTNCDQASVTLELSGK